MPVNPLVVNELRSLVRGGATPSAVVRRIAERHPGELRLDAVVRAYFREAFGVPAARIGPEQVRAAAGEAVPALNGGVLRRMIETRAEWDAGGGWLDELPAEPPPINPQSIPELAGSWERMDDTAREYVGRALAAARAAQQHADALAVLAEHLQPATPAATARRTG